MQETEGNSGTDGTLRNGYARNLRPTVKRTAAYSSRPYQPIRKHDSQEEVPEIDMFVGESRVFPTPNVGRIAVGNGAILTAAALDNKEVILFANAAGTSSLFVWNEDGRYQRVKINIVPGDTSRFAREIAAFLSSIPHAHTSVIGDKVIVEGDNLSDADLGKIEELAKRYPQIVNFANRLGWEKMVMMNVKVVEFPKKLMREIGLKWASQGGAAVGGIWTLGRRGNQPDLQIGIRTGSDNPLPITNADGSTTGIPVPSALNILSAINLGLNAQLGLLEQNGSVTLLAEPQLSARNGSKASFLAGGEYPYSVSTINGPTVVFKPYGIKLDIIPRVDHTGVIRAIIESEVSEIDSSVSTPAGPALSTRKTNTEFNVKSGETIVLAGLLSRHSGTSIDKVPLLGDIPVLGALFRSKRYQDNETELVVLVTPTVVDSKSPGLAERVQRAAERLQENLGNPPYLSQPLQPGRDPANTQEAMPRPYPAEAGKVTRSESDHASEVNGANAVLPIFEPPIPKLQLNPLSKANAPKADTIGQRASIGEPNAHDSMGSNTSTTAGSVQDGTGARYRVTLDGLALRGTPDINAPVLEHINQDTVVERPPQAASGYWTLIRVNGKRGWVASQWLASE